MRLERDDPCAGIERCLRHAGGQFVLFFIGDEPQLIEVLPQDQPGRFTRGHDARARS